MINKIPFGKTGHLSTRTIFGAAALGAMRQERSNHCDRVARSRPQGARQLQFQPRS